MDRVGPVLTTLRLVDWDPRTQPSPFQSEEEADTFSIGGAGESGPNMRMLFGQRLEQGFALRRGGGLHKQQRLALLVNANGDMQSVYKRAKPKGVPIWRYQCLGMGLDPYELDLHIKHDASHRLAAGRIILYHM